MLPHEKVTAAIAGARRDGRTALVPFLTAGYPEEACALLENFISHARNLHQAFSRSEGAMRVAVFNDILRKRRTDA